MATKDRPTIMPEVKRSIDEIPEIFRIAIRKSFHFGEWPLLLCGPPGIGKTCAALAFMDFVKEKYAEAVAIYYRLPALVNDINLASRGKLVHPITGMQRPAATVWNVWKNAFAVVLDEIGSDEAPPGIVDYDQAEQHCIFTALDSRLQTKKPTIIISNLHPKQLDTFERYSERVISRMNACVIVDGSALPDRRSREWRNGKRQAPKSSKS